MIKKLFPLFTLVTVITSACGNNEAVQNQVVGYAQGTTYQIKFITPVAQDWQAEFDSIFLTVDRSMSTYVKGSLIDLVNKGDTLVQVDPMFEKVLDRSMEIAQETEGLFDPTVGPLVRFWGFGKNQIRKADSTRVDSVLGLIGYEKISKTGNMVSIPKGCSIDFNAIAQGFTVDVIANFLNEKGVEHYMVEVGGEVRTRGTNVDGQIWRIGIDKPLEEMDIENRLQVILELKDRALATSGNYRKFWVDKESGMKYSHTIDPQTGHPARNRLLSASVIATNCMDADAYATACMVMGLEEAIKFIRNKQGVEAYFISSGSDDSWEVYYTEGFSEYIKN